MRGDCSTKVSDFKLHEFVLGNHTKWSQQITQFHHKITVKSHDKTHKATENQRKNQPNCRSARSDHKAWLYQLHRPHRLHPLRLPRGSRSLAAPMHLGPKSAEDPVGFVMICEVNGGFESKKELISSESWDFTLDMREYDGYIWNIKSSSTRIYQGGCVWKWEMAAHSWLSFCSALFCLVLPLSPEIMERHNFQT